MRIIVTLVLLLTTLTSFSQTIPGSYRVNGYFFHPSASRSINLSKTITQVATNTYQVDLGDVAGFSFQFSIDANNNLVNWVAIGSTPAAPASGFMTADNPGNITYTVTPLPGSSPWVHSTYNNKYDPSTGIFYMHYGYTGGSTSQNGYGRQVYEKWEPPILPHISSATPLSGTAYSQVTIRGQNFLNIDPAWGINFGGQNADSAVVLADTTIIAWVGGGASGPVRVSNANGIDSVAGFSYSPVAPVTDPQWNYVLNPGFSPGKASHVSAAIDRHNNLYVVFADSISRKAMVMQRTDTGWAQVGAYVSEPKATNCRIAIDTSNNPIVAYTDSFNNVAIKKYNVGSWVDLVMPAAKGKATISVDGNNNIYVVALDTSKVNVHKYDGASWSSFMNIGRSYYGGDVFIETDKAANIPYVIFDDFQHNGKPTVKKLNGANWETVGTAGFATGANGAFYPSLKIDNAGNPVASMQDDNGFERVSTYKLSGGNWVSQGLRYSKGRSYFVNMALTKTNKIFIAFINHSYNRQGTVMMLDGNSWDSVGKRGFVPATTFEPNALVVDTSGNPLIAFSDNSQGGKASVMTLNKYCYNNINLWTGAIDNNWNNPGNWGCGVVPTTESKVEVPAGASVSLQTSTTIETLDIKPGANIQIAPGAVLTITKQ